MAGGEGSLERTPTWSVAVVCLIIVAISIGIEHFLHSLGKYLLKKKKPALYEALEKVKTELMLLGFISLLLIVGQDPISRICIPESVGDTWHPCKPEKVEVEKKLGRRRLLSLLLLEEEDDGFIGGGGGGSFRRILAGSKYDKCKPKGKVPLISYDGIHQLHIFIFVLAVFHILYSICTLALGRLKMRRWKKWEQQTKTADYQFSHDPERFRFTRDTSFGRRHLSFWSQSTVLTWTVCFFRQFFGSVSKDDYLTLRHGFVTAHLAPESHVKFDFQRYINRSLEEDFKEVVGISPIIWFFAVLILLANTHGWYSYLWLPFIPLIIVLTVGTKLQVIITRMAVKIMDRGDVIKGVPIVQPDDHHFWFNRPRLMLNLIHFVLFQNAFQVSFFVFTTYKFGIHSCFHDQTADVTIRITMGVITQILCSYVTLPLYALVTQMGSNMKPAIFNERVAAALRKWHHTARKHIKENRKSGSTTPTTSRPATPLTSRPTTPTHRFSAVNSEGMSPVHLLRNYQGEMDSSHVSHRTHISEADRMDIEKSINSYRRATEGSSHYYSDGSSHHQGRAGTQDEMDEEKEIQMGTLYPMQPMPQRPADESRISIDFSFDKRRTMK